MKVTTLLLLAILVFIKTDVSHGANILFYHLISSYSHRIAVWPLVEALVAKGHNVTFVQSYPPKKPNPQVHEFYPEALGDIFEFVDEDGTVHSGNNFASTRVERGPWELQQFAFIFPFISYGICDKFLSVPETQEWVKSNKFDLVVIDFLVNECAYGLAKKWNAKTIVYFTSAPTGTWGMETLGFLGTDERAWISDQIIPFQMPMTFLARVTNTLISTIMHIIKEQFYYPWLDELVQVKLNLSYVSISQFVRETDLVFYNSHFSEGEARSLPPSFVAVPALQAWETKIDPLPKEIAEFIEGSGNDGFIYVSFGGEADITTTPEEFQNIFYHVFEKTPIRFLWKRSGERPKELSQNVYMADWMPQKDILASPKCKGFITHGGLLGMQEALMSGVPMISLPVFAEQEYNAYRLERTGRGIKLEMHTLTSGELEGAINEIRTNSSYKENVKKAGMQLRDQQNSPIETAVFWTEYVLRNDMSRLRPFNTQHNYWFQNLLLDVWAFFLVTVTTLAFLAFFILRKISIFLWKLLRGRKKLKIN